MAKKEIPKKTVQPIPIRKKESNKKFWIMAAIVFVVSFIFYGASINNEYALDDGITMEKNEYVHKGMEGIGDIMTKDAYESFFKQLNSKGQLSGGRYRPLSIITFAIEYDMFGFHPGDMISVTGTDGKTYKGKVEKMAPDGVVTYKNKEFGDGMSPLTKVHQFKSLAHVQHFNNVLLFAISMVVLFYFLYDVLFRRLDHREYWAVFATLFFVMHPLHSEVVANIKSRDEILSLLFILLTLINFGCYLSTKKMLHAALIPVWFFLALLSKEYAVVLLAILPVWGMLEAWRQKQREIFIRGLISTGIVSLIFVFYYYALRVPAIMVADANTKSDVLNDYYLFAKGDEKRATQVYILLKYFWLQMFPYPLSSDYSFNSISYQHFSSSGVFVSVLLHLLMILGLVLAMIRKNIILVFAFMFYLLNLLLVSNLVFNIGASMGERLVYNSSLGFTIMLFYSLYWITQQIKNPKAYYLGGVVVALVLIPFFMITQGRNAAWKNDYTLATTDVKTNPNSALLNANACTYTIQKSEEFANKNKEIELTLEAKKYNLKALEIHPEFANAWMNLAVIEHKLKNYEGEEKAIKKVVEIFPTNPKVPLFKNMLAMDYINLGFEKYKAGKPDSCFIYLYKAKSIDPNNPEVLYNLGGAYLSVANRVDSAVYYFQKALAINPQHPGATQGYNSIRASHPELPALTN